MTRISGAVKRIQIALWIAMAAALTGCGGYVEGGGTVVVPGPVVDVGWWGGGYDRGRDVHAYSHRGEVSRSVAHPAPGRGVAHVGAPGGRHI